MKRLRTQSPEAASQHAKYKQKDQTSQWTFLPTRTLQAAPDLRRQSLQQVVSSQSNDVESGAVSADRQLMGLDCLVPQAALLPSTAAQSFFPLVHAPKYLVDEWVRGFSMPLNLVSVLAFSHQSTNNEYCIHCLISTQR